MGKTSSVGVLPTVRVPKIQDVFSWASNTPNAKIANEVGVICSKDKRGTGHNLKFNWEVATKVINPPFGVAKHFVSSLDGETDEGNQTKGPVD